MAKLFVFFVFCFSLCTIMSVYTEGTGAGFATTSLTVGVDVDDATLQVVSTSGFLDTDYVLIGTEKIAYTGRTATTFTGLTRGYDGTTAAAHESGSKVFNEASGVMNQLVGFNIAVTGSTTGTFSALIQTGVALIFALPRLLMWDYSFLSGELIIIKYAILYPLSAGLVISFVALFIGAAQTLWRG